jgi:uncharacterized protein with ATP-grasp and redox domains
VSEVLYQKLGSCGKCGNCFKARDEEEVEEYKEDEDTDVDWAHAIDQAISATYATNASAPIVALRGKP